jgi:hypothetical protein
VTQPSEAEIRAALLDLALRRGARASLCPSEVARRFGPGWRALMPVVRRVAADMAEIEVTQRGRPVDPAAARGPIRFRLRGGA